MTTHVGPDTRRLARAAGLAEVAIPVGLVPLFSVLNPSAFPTLVNLNTILNTAAIPIVLGVGASLVVLTGRIDLSVEGAMGAAGMVFVLLSANSRETADLGWLAYPAVLLVGAALGGLTRVSAINPSEFAWRVADRVSAECYMLASPVYAPDARTREALMGHPGITEVFTRAQSLDMAVLSVGDLIPLSVFSEYGPLTRDEIASLEAAGAVGDLLCHFIDAEGNVIDHPINTRVLAVDPLSLRGTRQIVLALGGWHKLAVIRAALKLLRPAVLVVNDVVAERLAAESR